MKWTAALPSYSYDQAMRSSAEHGHAAVAHSPGALGLGVKDAVAMRLWTPAARALDLGARLSGSKKTASAAEGLATPVVQMLREKLDHVIDLQFAGALKQARALALSTFDIAREEGIASAAFVVNRKMHLLASSALAGDFELIDVLMRRGAVAWGEGDAAAIVASKALAKWPSALARLLDVYLYADASQGSVAQMVQGALVNTQDPLYILQAVRDDAVVASTLALKYGTLELARAMRGAAQANPYAKAWTEQLLDIPAPDPRFVIE